MAVKYFSTENSPLLDKRWYVRDDEIQIDDYSSPSSSSTDVFKSSSPFSYFENNRTQPRFRRYIILLLAFFASLCIALFCLTGYALHGHERYHDSHHMNRGTKNHGHSGKRTKIHNRDGLLDTSGGTVNATTSNNDTKAHRKHKKGHKKRNRKRHEDQIIAEKAFQKHLLDHSSTRKNLPDPCHGEIVIIRHCEKKGSIKGHCNHVGYERAEYIATFFSNGKDNENKIGNDYSEGANHQLVPSYLFATSPGHRNPHIKNYREIETLQLLSSLLGLEINSSYGMNNREDLTKHLFELLKNGDLCGRVALISWKHGDVPRLARRYVNIVFCYVVMLCL